MQAQRQPEVQLPTAAWPAWSLGSFIHDMSYQVGVKRSCKLRIHSHFQQVARDALGVPGLPNIFFASDEHAQAICRRLACRVWGGLPRGNNPFSLPLSDAERAACWDWLQLSGAEVADRLVAEHVAGSTEVTRRGYLQQLLDARSMPLQAAQLEGIAVSSGINIRLRKGQEIASRPARPYRAALCVSIALAAAMEADGSLPATSAACIKTSDRFDAHNLFADVEQAVAWRDQQYFKAFGTCAPFALS